MRAPHPPARTTAKAVSEIFNRIFSVAVTVRVSYEFFFSHLSSEVG